MIWLAVQLLIAYNMYPIKDCTTCAKKNICVKHNKCVNCKHWYCSIEEREKIVKEKIKESLYDKKIH